MRKDIVFRKGLVVGIIVLFVGASVIPSMSGNIEETNIIPEVKDDDLFNEPSMPVDDGSSIKSSLKHRGSMLYVGGCGPGNYTSIQNAIDNATDGDTVYVFSGTYYENVLVTETINLIGEDKNDTIIDGNGNDDVINIQSDDVNISDFTI